MFHSFLTRFHEVVEVHGDRIAVEAGPVRLTYRELREQAGAVAAALREREIGPGEVVGLVEVQIFISLQFIIRTEH